VRKGDSFGRARIFLAVVLFGATFFLATPAEAYYHYVHFNRNALGNPSLEKFDLNALGPSKTVTFFVNDQGPSVLAPGDSFGSVLGEVKQALAAWDSISTSDLRVAFGGLETTGQNSITPGGDVVFQDLPPGLLGQGMPTSSGTTILRGTVILSNNTNRGAGPSYLEEFFTTAVHEVGHALGLQHTWTGAAMSQDVIRDTSRARKLDADDVAAISVLYGHNNWQANYGSISGRVTFTNGTPVALASVVALNPSGSAVSALTNPDGSYRIDGIPAGNNSNYYIYVHPLPPDAIPSDNSGLRLPVDQNGTPLPASAPFGTVFYPGTTDVQAAATFQIGPGTNLTGRDFSVRPQAAVSMYDIITYSYLEPANRSAAYAPSSAAIGITPAFVNTTQGLFLIVAKANSGDTPVPQSATILGGFGAATGQYLQPYLPSNSSQRALKIYFAMPLGAGTGPRHMVFNIGTDMYVLPNAVNLVQHGAPAIASVTANPDNSLTVTGSGLGSDSLVFVDGLQATVQTPFSGSDAAGSITVVPPPGLSGQTSNIIVFDSDGQNSTFLQPQNQPTYTYPALPTPQISVDKTVLPAGSTSLVNITGQNTNFVAGLVTLGFGSDDVTIQHLWVVSPTQLQANIVVAAGAPLATSEISVISGFQVITNPSPFQVQAANPAVPVVAVPAVNANSNQQTIYPGSTVTIFVANLPSNAQVTLNDAAMVITFANSSQINFVIPGGFPTGLATLKVIGGAASSNPVLVPIVSPPPVIQTVTNASGASYDSSRFASASETINIYVTGLDPTVQFNPSRVQVTVSGVSMPVLSITPAPGNQFQIQTILTQSFGGQQVPVAVLVDGSTSPTVQITVR
jgi:uncharacterized protein (TIGR03437 family)